MSRTRHSSLRFQNDEPIRVPLDDLVSQPAEPDLTRMDRSAPAIIRSGSLDDLVSQSAEPIGVALRCRLPDFASRPDSSPRSVSRTKSQPVDQLVSRLPVSAFIDPETIPFSDNNSSTLGDIFADAVTPRRRIYPEIKFHRLPSETLFRRLTFRDLRSRQAVPQTLFQVTRPLEHTELSPDLPDTSGSRAFARRSECPGPRAFARSPMRRGRAWLAPGAFVGSKFGPISRSNFGPASRLSSTARSRRALARRQ